MSKKAFIIGAIALVTKGAIATTIYLVTRPKPVSPVSGCDILLTKMLEAKKTIFLALGTWSFCVLSLYY